MAVLSKIAILIFTVLFLCPLHSFSAAPPDVQAVAEQGLSEFLANIPPAELAKMGLTSANDIEAATLGEPYEQFTILPDALAGYTPDQSLFSLLTTTDNWVFPVMVNGTPRTQLNVVKSEGRWVAGYFGGTLPARIQQGTASMTTSFGAGNPEGITRSNIDQAKLVRIPQINADFLFVETDEEEYLYPIGGASALTQVVGGKIYSGFEIIPILNLEVIQSIKVWNKNFGKEVE